jgi:tRNA A-37 threonylcarbamoyl transferase component Bud32
VAAANQPPLEPNHNVPPSSSNSAAAANGDRGPESPQPEGTLHVPSVNQAETPPPSTSEPDSCATRYPPPPSPPSNVSSPVDWPTIPGYEMLEELGQGGMGIVLKARQLHLDRIVALKVIRKEYLAHEATMRRFQREAKAAARLSHPNIVTLFDAPKVGDRLFLVMEYVEGTDLGRLVREHGQLPVAQACDYIRQASLGLQHAFERGLVHRDIKPGNLLLTKQWGVIKLLDMGLARLDQANPMEGDYSEITQHGQLMGTPDYLAPEQAANASAADIRSDLYSLGCTLYFLLTGQAPFPGGSLTEKLVKHAIHDPEPIEKLRPEIPAGVCAIVQRLLAKDPQARYQTPAEVAAALEPFTGADRSTIQVPVYPSEPGVKARSSGLLVGLVILLLLAAGGGGLAFFWLVRSRDKSAVAQGDTHSSGATGSDHSTTAAKATRSQHPTTAAKATSHSPPTTKGGSAQENKPANVTPEELVQYELQLDKDPSQALAQFTEALARIGAMKPIPLALQMQARLGQARAYARLKKWSNVQEALRNLPLEEPKDKAHQQVLEVLALAGLAPPTSSDFDSFLNRLRSLYQPQLKGLYDPWELKELQALNHRVTDLALKAAVQVRRFDRDQPFQMPYRKEDVAKASGWLKKAYNLLKSAEIPVPRELGHEFALADYWSHPSEASPDDAELLKDVATDPPSLENIPFLYVKALTQPVTTEGWKTAFACYDALWKLTGNNPKVPVKERYDKILAPALDNLDEVLKKADPALKKRVAGLLVAKAQFIKTHDPHFQTWTQSDAWDAYERAVKVNPDPVTLTALSVAYREYAETLKDEKGLQKDYLDKARTKAEDALKRTQEGYAYHALGLALEDLAWRQGETDRYKIAIEAFTAALSRGEPSPRYWLDRGRCFLKRYLAQGKANGEDRQKAVQDLQTALAKKLPEEFQVQANLWLGWAIREGAPAFQDPDHRQARDYYATALRLASKPGGAKSLDRDQLESLTQWALYNQDEYRKAGTGPDGPAYLQTAVDAFAALTRLAALSQNSIYHKYAADQLCLIGDNYLDKKKPVQALETYQKGLPEKLTETSVADFRLLVHRTTLFLEPEFKVTLAKSKPSPEELMRHADLGVKLAISEDSNPAKDKAEAYTTAALAYREAKKTKEGLVHLKKAHEWIVKALEAAKVDDEKKVCADQKRVIEMLLKKWEKE